MHSRPIRIFMTFVLPLIFTWPTAHAAISQPSPDYSEPAPPADPPFDPNADVLTKQSLDIANPPLPSHVRDSTEYFHRYRKSLTVRFGPYRGLDENNQGLMYGLIYNFPAFTVQSLEAGADLLSNGTGTLHLAKRFEFSRTRFRPFLKAGVGVRVVPEQQLTTFLKLANYQVRLGAGFEHLVRTAQSIRVDVGFLIMTDTQQLVGTVGYVWAW